MTSPINPYQAPQAAPLLGEKFGLFGQSPTHVRYRIIMLTALMSILLYLDRFCIGPVTDNIISELGLEKKEFGWAIGLFFWSYALFQVPAGWLSDTFGSRVTLIVYVIGWSLVTMCFGFANSLFAFLTLRILLGIAQAGAYPTAAGYIKKWIPVEGRAGANGTVTMSGRAGGMLAFAITPLLMVVMGRLLGWEVGQWRAVFVLYGLLGLAWSVLFWFQFRESPRMHSACNQTEVEFIEQGIPHVPSTSTALPVAALLTHPNVWLLSVSGFFINVGWVFVVTWLTPYLKEVHGAQLAEYFGADATPESINRVVDMVKGPLTAITGVAGMIGSVTGGLIADRLRRSFGPIWGRRIPGMVAGTIAAGVYIACLFITDVWLFLGMMAAIYFLTDLGLGALWATYQDFGGKHVGSVLGFANMCGNLGAAACGILIGYLADADQWPVVFMISSGSFVVVVTCWFFVDPTRQLVPVSNPNLEQVLE